MSGEPQEVLKKFKISISYKVYEDYVVEARHEEHAEEVWLDQNACDHELLDEDSSVSHIDEITEIDGTEEI